MTARVSPQALFLITYPQSLIAAKAVHHWILLLYTLVIIAKRSARLPLPTFSLVVVTKRLYLKLVRVVVAAKPASTLNRPAAKRGQTFNKIWTSYFLVLILRSESHFKERH